MAPEVKRNRRRHWASDSTKPMLATKDVVSFGTRRWKPFALTGVFSDSVGTNKPEGNHTQASGRHETGDGASKQGEGEGAARRLVLTAACLACRVAWPTVPLVGSKPDALVLRYATQPEVH